MYTLKSKWFVRGHHCWKTILQTIYRKIRPTNCSIGSYVLFSNK